MSARDPGPEQRTILPGATHAITDNTRTTHADALPPDTLLRPQPVGDTDAAWTVPAYTDTPDTTYSRAGDLPPHTRVDLQPIPPV